MPDILVADDDRGMQALLRDVFESEGYSVRAATDGAEALDAIRDREPSVLILDLAMPKLDGFGVVRELERLGTREHFPIFVLTARHDGCERAAELRAEGCARKPFDIDDLLKSVGRLLDGGSAA